MVFSALPQHVSEHSQSLQEAEQLHEALPCSVSSILSQVWIGSEDLSCRLSCSLSPTCAFLLPLDRVWSLSALTAFVVGSRGKYRPDFQICWVEKMEDSINILNWVCFFAWMIIFMFQGIMILVCSIDASGQTSPSRLFESFPSFSSLCLLTLSSPNPKGVPTFEAPAARPERNPPEETGNPETIPGLRAGIHGLLDRGGVDLVSGLPGHEGQRR